MPLAIIGIGAIAIIGGIASYNASKGFADSEVEVAKGLSKNTALAVSLAGAALIIYAYNKSA